MPRDLAGREIRKVLREETAGGNDPGTHGGDWRRADGRLKIANPILLASNRSGPRRPTALPGTAAAFSRNEPTQINAGPRDQRLQGGDLKKKKGEGGYMEGEGVKRDRAGGGGNHDNAAAIQRGKINQSRSISVLFFLVLFCVLKCQR